MGRAAARTQDPRLAARVLLCLCPPQLLGSPCGSLWLLALPSAARRRRTMAHTYGCCHKLTFRIIFIKFPEDWGGEAPGPGERPSGSGGAFSCSLTPVCHIPSALAMWLGAGHLVSMKSPRVATTARTEMPEVGTVLPSWSCQAVSTLLGKLHTTLSAAGRGRHDM